MPIPTLLVLSLLTLGAHGHPDKFWLDASDSKPSLDGTQPRLIEGVLIDQDETHYHVRVEGGEVWLEKSKVRKVEKDGLKVATIEQAEKQAKEQRAAQERAAATAEAKAAATAAAVADKHGHDAEPIDASFRDEVVELAAPEAPIARFDPVVGVYRPGRESRDAALLRDLEIAYQMTGHREYIKLIRKLRRLR